MAPNPGTKPPDLGEANNNTEQNQEEKEEPGPSEFRCENGITVYGTPEVRAQLITVTEKFPDVWKIDGPTIDIPEDEWLAIPLKPGAVPPPAKVYQLSEKDKKVIDDIHDSL